MTRGKKIRVILISILFITLSLTINKYRVGYLKDYIKEGDFTSLHIIQHEMGRKEFKEIQIKDPKKVQEIYDFISKYKIRRKVRWSSLLRMEDGEKYDLTLVTGPENPIYSFSLIGDDYIILYDSYEDQSTIFRYVDGSIDLEYFRELIEEAREQ